MALWKPDPTFYPSPRQAVAAPPEKLAYIAAFDRAAEQPDAIAVLDVDPGSDRYGTVVGWTDMPFTGDELHHFGWNACSSALCPYAPHPHVERRYLIVPGLRSSRIYVLDTKDDPTQPKIIKVLEAEELAKRAGYSRPHTIHCGPEGIYVSALGGANGNDGPGGIALLDHTSFEVLGRWEIDRGPQYFGVRRLVAPGPTRAGHQRVGHPVDDRGRAGRRAAAGPQVRPRAALLGPAQAHATSRRSTSATSTRWCWSCGRRMIRPRTTASSAWWSVSRTCPRRSGCGTGEGQSARSPR